MSSEAQRRASKKYYAANVFHLNIALNKTTDAAIIDRLQTIGNKQGYIKKLIEDDIKREAASEGDSAPSTNI